MTAPFPRAFRPCVVIVSKIVKLTFILYLEQLVQTIIACHLHNQNNFNFKTEQILKPKPYQVLLSGVALIGEPCLLLTSSVSEKTPHIIFYNF